jgi:hypothetical protein
MAVLPVELRNPIPMHISAGQAAVNEMARMKKATEKAKLLLEANLTVQQNQDMLHHHMFMVNGGSASGGSSGQPYIIMTFRNYSNVARIRSKDNIEFFCALIKEEIEYFKGMPTTKPIPYADHFLAQKLWLENDEAAFFNIAIDSGKYKLEELYFEYIELVGLYKMMIRMGLETKVPGVLLRCAYGHDIKYCW